VKGTAWRINISLSHQVGGKNEPRVRVLLADFLFDGDVARKKKSRGWNFWLWPKKLIFY